MPTTRWARSEILGKRIHWLCDITFAGRIFRFSRQDLSVPSDALGYDLAYRGVLEAITFRESLDLFSDSGEPNSADLTVTFPVDLAALLAEGHRLTTVELSQWVEGTDYSRRRLVLTGDVTDPVTTVEGVPTRFSATQRIWEEDQTIPDPTAIVRDTFNGGSVVGLSDEDRGLTLPLIFGMPGNDPEIPAGWATGSKARWLDKRYLHHQLVVADGHVGIPNRGSPTSPPIPLGDPVGAVYLNTDDYPAGGLFAVRHGYDDTGRAITYVNDANTTTGDRYDGLEAISDPSFQPGVHDDPVQVWVGWTDFGGILGPNGAPIRAAGDILEYVLRYTGRPVDRGMIAAEAGKLACFALDCTIEAGCSPWEWITAHLLPILPVSVICGPRGLGIKVFRWNATARDAIAHLNEDTQNAVEFSDEIEADSSTLANDFSLKFGRSRRTDTFLHTARLGSGYKTTKHLARADLVSPAGSRKRIRIVARESGAAGVGILVKLTHTGVSPPNLGTDDPLTKTVEVTYDSGSDNVDDIVAAFQGSTQVTAEDDSDATNFGSAPDPATTVLNDDSRGSSLACFNSQLRNKVGQRTGKRIWDKTTETEVVWARSTASLILQWWAALYSAPWRKVTIGVPEDRWGWLALGSIVELTASRLGLSRRLAHIVDMEWGDDGRIVLTAFLHPNPLMRP